MSSLWIKVLNQRFFYTKELLLGVSIWSRSVVSHKKAAKSLSSQRWKRVSLLVISAFVLVGIGIISLPQAYYSIVPASTIEIKPDIIGSPLGGAFDSKLQTQSKEETKLPERDLSLPVGDWLIIPDIGVKTHFLITDEADEALKTGVWLSPDFGKPGDQGMPIILAAHRFGWSWWWQSDYGRLNSFYRLPETKPGTIAELISDQRKWSYEIFAGEEGEEITRYDADLILYTCKHLSSPIRHIRYARLIETPQIISSEEVLN